MSPDNDDLIKISPEEELEAFKRYFNETKPPKNCYETQKKIIRQDSFGNDVEYMVLTVCDLNDNIIEERTVKYSVYQKEIAGEKPKDDITKDAPVTVSVPNNENHIEPTDNQNNAVVNISDFINVDSTALSPDNTEKNEKKKNIRKVFIAVLCVALPVAIILLCIKIGQNYIGKNSADKIKVVEIVTEAIDEEDATETLLININTATAAELTALPGIGETKAKKIVAYREANGNFGSIEDIKNVSGIGDATFENIKSYITVGSDNTSEISENGKKSEEQDNETGSIVNINTATAEELTVLPGIGEAKAKKIVAYREANGDFGSVDEIKNVSGIGDGTFEQIKNSITVGNNQASNAAESATGDAKSTSEKQSKTTNSIININTATAAELTSLPGIGESKAKKIVAYREANGNFGSVEEIKNVSGIGDGTFENIKSYITVGTVQSQPKSTPTKAPETVKEKTATEKQNNTISSIININTATAAELTSLPGIGEAKAKKIVAYRETNGNFGSIDEIKNVSGIGDGTFENIKNYITVGTVQSQTKSAPTKAPETGKEKTATEKQNNTISSIININTATAAELTSLPGIGEAKAKKIVAYRETNGNFGSIEEIKNVSGIGDATFENIKSYITVGSVQSQNKTTPTKAPETEKVQTKASEQATADEVTDTQLININTADIAELDKLPGIGEATAKKIIAYREENGDFKSIEDIMNVSGIAEKKFEKLKDYITVD